MLDEIGQWARDSENPVFWLSGLAGTGKSAIAQTTAERMSAEGRLGAEFFCSRDSEDRGDLQLIFPSLAFQLALRYPKFRASLVQLLMSDPDISYKSLRNQMEELLIKPLQAADISTVILIDALDECEDAGEESAVLLAIGDSISRLPGVKFFITSRPEVHIKAAFRRQPLQGSTDVLLLHDVELPIIKDDIRHFFKSKLSSLAQRRGVVKSWPTDEQLDLLCQRADVFFLFAVATINYLDHIFEDPPVLLDEILKSPESTAYEGARKLQAYGSLDSLYMSVLKKSFRNNGLIDYAAVHLVLSTVVLADHPLSSPAIATLTGLFCKKVQRILQLVQSLLVLPTDPHGPVRQFHKAFSEFITDPSRCTDPRFYIPPDSNIELFMCCIDLMKKSLKRNMCSTSGYTLNSEVDGLSEGIEESGVNGGLEYACRFWYKHLVATGCRTPEALSALRHFLEEKFVFWLEALSVLGAVGDAVRALTATLRWLNQVRYD